MPAGHLAYRQLFLKPPVRPPHRCTPARNLPQTAWPPTRGQGQPAASSDVLLILLRVRLPPVFPVSRPQFLLLRRLKVRVAIFVFVLVLVCGPPSLGTTRTRSGSQVLRRPRRLLGCRKKDAL
ncbi:hypothetical protein B0H14DRAFT_3470743 [Mycena olivaceomarginata]|nr:hypothetical protein B0H14DRAFT_3470743 [Mycena olivaceomarginata]